MAGSVPKILKTVGKGLGVGASMYEIFKSSGESLRDAYCSKNPDEMKKHMEKAVENTKKLKNESEIPSAQTLHERVGQTYWDMEQEEKNDNSNKNAEYLGFEDLYELLEEVASDLDLLEVLQQIFPRDLLKN